MAGRNSTRSQILGMGGAGIISRIMLMLVPVSLVRLLDVDAFGEYRLLWLLANTVLLVAALGMPNSLLYFMPRSAPMEKRQYLYQTVLLTVGTGLLAALLTGPWNSWLPESLRSISTQIYTVPLFVFLWVVGSTIQVLPNSEQRVGWQVRAIVVTSVFRAGLIVGVAVWTRDLEMVFLAMIGVALFQIMLLLLYATRYHGWSPQGVDMGGLWRQLQYAIPTGIATGMYQIRKLNEQWIVALLFSPAAFGIFSVALTVFPLVQLVRMPVRAVILPKMSHAQHANDISRLLHLNREGNAAVSLVLLPAIGALLVLAGPIIEILFGGAYKEAAGVLRIYCLAMVPQAVEVGTILMAYAQTRFVMGVSSSLTVLAAIISVVGAMTFGPVGAALGSMLVGYIAMWINLQQVKRVTGTTIKGLQDWGRLGNILLAVVASCIATFVVTNVLVGNWSAWIRLLSGGCVFACSYLGLLLMFGYGWMIKSFLGRGKWSA